MRHKDYWIKSAPTTRGRRGIGTTMHGNRMRSISSSIVYHHASSSPTCIVHSGRTCAWPWWWPHGRRWRPLVTTMHAYLSPSIDLRLSWAVVVFVCLSRSGRPLLLHAQKLCSRPKAGQAREGRESPRQPLATTGQSVHHFTIQTTRPRSPYVRACQCSHSPLRSSFHYPSDVRIVFLWINRYYIT
jgi:hypothetical protein